MYSKIVVWLIVVMALLATVGAHVTAQAADERRLALVVGNSAYATAPLRNPSNDAGAMANKLRELGFEVMLHTDLDQRGFVRALQRFGEQLRGGGVGLFYFAGHGVQVGGENYMIPVGARIELEPDVEVEGVRVARVLAEMEKANNRLNLVILDACRDNPYARSFRSAARGLAPVNAPAGVLVAYATGPGMTAADGEGNNGLYTSELLRAMSLQGLKVEDVFKQARARVQEKSGGRQVPWESSSLVGEFYFFGPVTILAPPAPTPGGGGVSESAEVEFRKTKGQRRSGGL